MNYFTCLGNVADGHLKHLEEGCEVKWTINKAAKRGDKVLFYITAPTSAFVARGKVEEHATPETRGRWKGHFMAPISAIELLPKPWVKIGDLKNRIPEFGWLKSPIPSAHIEKPILAKLLAALRSHAPTPTPPNSSPPARTEQTVYRIQRDSALVSKLKNLYQFKCQICAGEIETAVGHYIEVHHLRPLGGKHRGLDCWDNMLVLCPTCHAKLDLHAIGINPDNKHIESLDKKAIYGRRLATVEAHQLAPENVQYAWKFFKARQRLFQRSRK